MSPLNVFTCLFLMREQSHITYPWFIQFLHLSPEISNSKPSYFIIEFEAAVCEQIMRKLLFEIIVEKRRGGGGESRAGLLKLVPHEVFFNSESGKTVPLVLSSCPCPSPNPFKAKLSLIPCNIQ